jgi:hypothetical protein
MAQTFEQAVAAVNISATSSTDRLSRIKALLDATETALFNSAVGGGVTRYKINTGQTQIEVESDSVSTLRLQWRELYATYNEMYGIIYGTNVMVARDASTVWR